jgi:small subunit ribosomal protein S7e
MESCDEDTLWETFLAANKNMSQEEQDNMMDDFVEHPLNAKTLDVKCLDRPEFAALHALAYEGTKEEVANNFRTHGYKSLEKLIQKTTKNQQKDIEEAIHCFSEGIDQKCGVYSTEFALYMGRAKVNILIS